MKFNFFDGRWRYRPCWLVRGLDPLDPTEVAADAGEDGGEGDGAAILQPPGHDADDGDAAVLGHLDQRAATVTLENKNTSVFG